MKRIELKDIKEKDLFYFGERVEPYFIPSLTISGMQNVRRSIKLFGIKSAIRWLQYNDYFYQLVSDLAAIEKEITERIEQASGQYVSRLIEGCLKAGGKLQKQSADYGRAVKNLTTREEMAKAILEYEKAVLNYTIYYQITFFERPVMNLAKEIVKKYVKDEPASRKLFSLITAPDRLTAAEREQDDFLRIAMKSEKEKERLAEKHAKKYGWLSIRYFLGQPWSKEDVLDRLKGVDKDWAKLELKRKLSHRQEREKKINEAIKKFSQKDKKIVWQIRQLVFLRTQRGDFFNETAYHVRPLLLKIAAELRVDYADLLHLPAREMVLALQEKIDYLDIIKKRKENFLIYHDLGKREVLAGDEVMAYLKIHPFLKTEVKNVVEFSGQIGYEGKVKGMVKIIKVNQDIGKVKKGDIVVTAMTTANFLPALERAAAFVTDEGGITCHAAIIAREMKKPCIIGTKIATKVLHDGDLVEVDANKGIVKILKRK